MRSHQVFFAPSSHKIMTKAMKILSILVFQAICITLHLNDAMSFSLSSPKLSTASTRLDASPTTDENDSSPSSRRGFVSRVVETAVVATSIGLVELSTPVAFADVSDGNALPEGAAQFSRLVRQCSHCTINHFSSFHFEFLN